MKAVLVASICLMLMVGTAFSAFVSSDTPPAGWGYDCTQWITYSDEWASGELCWATGEGWLDCETHTPVLWPALNIEMWIEMECLLYWDATTAQIHRASDYSNFLLTFCGWSKCNHGQYIITTPPTLLGSLDYLPFVSGVVGSYNTTYDVDIPLTWTYSLDGSAYAPMDDGGDGAKQFVVDACDHSFCIQVFGDVIYHQGDGYYYLGGPGCYICPAEPL